MSDDDLATRQPVVLRADPSRVIARLFVPGSPNANSGHVGGALAHILELDEHDVEAGLAEIVDRFGGRHRDLLATFRKNAERVADRIPDDRDLSEARRTLLGAAFTHEYSVEAAALCNPSLVLAPSQTTGSPGSADFVMSGRGIGEGHRSSIVLREASIGEDGQVSIGQASLHSACGAISGATLHADTFRQRAERVRGDADSTRWVLAELGETFSHVDLDQRLLELQAHADTRPKVDHTVRRLRALARRSYRVDFDPTRAIGERILYPATPAEHNGVEDARFVRIVDNDHVRYCATYTAYDGTNIAQQLLETTDFCRFESSPIQGPGARNKGLAFFPRRIDGRYAALSRHDGATNAVSFSDNLRHWPAPRPIHTRPTLGNSIQVGNCGSPIETDDGWLVLTHGVGPMRTYSISACLVDLDDPTQVLAELRRPLLSPQPDEQDGYVPNVVYSCGAVLHGPNLVIPYGVGDAYIRFANVPLATLLREMTAS